MPESLKDLLDPTVLAVIGIASAVLAVVSLLGLPFLLTRIPADYLTRPRAPARFGTARWFGRIAKNLLGGLLLLAGIAMMVLPGQGVLTIFAALIFLDFPGKRRFERWLLRHHRVMGTVNALRARFGHPPLELDASLDPSPLPHHHD